uniref:AlNc14C80G5281 protein n=1 Tax=Albugo laibachii Nc14 TaxID=890382 RepID=F0WF89_9STRA|nr:AlNc14C80G5281 [Albugo laibachii Nc14]|eukprot:CCA19871.1 AlNc14C80G5281 [Albugo laibachii Nc14]
MRRYELDALLLVVLISSSMKSSTSHVHHLSGIINVISADSNDFFNCHECLEVSMGPTKISLLRAENTFRLYWIEGHMDMLQAFISHCSTRKICFISYIIQQIYNPYSETLRLNQRINDWEKPCNVEQGAYLLAKSLSWRGLMKDSRHLIVRPSDRYHDISLFTQKQAYEIPNLFWHEIRHFSLGSAFRPLKPEVIIISSRASAYSKIQSGDSTRTKHQQCDSSIRCMVVPLTFKEAVPRMFHYAQ